jgi:hypothetical protein
VRKHINGRLWWCICAAEDLLPLSVIIEYWDKNRRDGHRGRRRPKMAKAAEEQMFRMKRFLRRKIKK